MAATPYPAYRGLSQAQTSQARAGAAPPGKVSNTVPVISPGGGCRLTRPTESSHRLIPRSPRKRSAAGQDIRHGTCNFAGWRLRLARPTGASHRLIPVGPRKRSAAGQDIRHGTCNFAGWRLRLARPTGASHRLIPVGPRKRSAAGQDIRHGTCNFAGWRLSPYPVYRVLLQAHTP